MIKNYLKLFGTWCIFDALYILVICHDNLVQYIGLYLLSIAALLIFIIVFLPLAVGLYFLFKKIVNQNYRILITACFTILFSVIFYLITKGSNFEFSTIIFYALLLFWFLPTIFLSIVFVPDNLFSSKKNILTTLFLIEILGLLVVFLIGCFVKGNPFEKYELKPDVKSYINCQIS